MKNNSINDIIKLEKDGAGGNNKDDRLKYSLEQDIMKKEAPLKNNIRGRCQKHDEGGCP